VSFYAHNFANAPVPPGLSAGVAFLLLMGLGKRQLNPRAASELSQAKPVSVEKAALNLDLHACDGSRPLALRLRCRSQLRKTQPLSCIIRQPRVCPTG
jgi:hypothetical protein